MGSRYDVAALRGVTLDQFATAFAERGTLGERVARPWEGPSGVTVAQIDDPGESIVVVVGPPEQLPYGIDAFLAQRLGVEGLFATVWDTVSSYSLSIIGPGVDRSLSSDALDADEEWDDEPSEPTYEASGDPIPEEPAWMTLDEAYVQTVFMRRCGIDPGNLYTLDATWYSLEPRARTEQRDRPAEEGFLQPPSPEPEEEARPGMWARVRRWLRGGA
ncbi:MAG: hypothetical protein ACK5LO_02165 [Leucobacter sp.]